MSRASIVALWILSYVLGALPVVAILLYLSDGLRSGQLAWHVAYGLVPVAGVVEGLVQGAVQARVLRRAGFAISGGRWIAATVIFMVCLWGFAALGAELEQEDEDLPVAVLIIGSLWMMAAFGGAKGALQWLVLRRTVRFAGAWIIANAGALVISGSVSLLLGGGQADFLTDYASGGVVETLVTSALAGAACALGVLYMRPAARLDHDGTGQFMLVVGPPDPLVAELQATGAQVERVDPVASIAEAEALAERILEWPQLDRLVFLTTDPPASRILSPDNVELTTAREVVTPYVLIRELTDALAIARGRVVLVATTRHRLSPRELDLAFEGGTYHPDKARGRADFARLQLVVGLTGPLRGRGITIIATEPRPKDAPATLSHAVLAPRLKTGLWYVGVMRQNADQRIYVRHGQVQLINALAALREVSDE